MSLDPTDPRPHYQQIAGQLREAIRTGQYQAGDAVPSIRDLAERYGVAPNTARQALTVLVLEGLLDVRRPSGGHFVRAVRPVIHVSSVYVSEAPDQPPVTFGSEMAKNGQKGEQRLLFVGRVVAPDEIAVRLGLDDGQVVVRRRLMLVDQHPYQLADSYYPEDVAGGTVLENPGAIRGGTVAALRAMGLDLRRCHEEISAKMPTPEQRQSLALGAGIPVVRLLRTTYAAEDRAVEVMDALMSGDRHVLTYDLPMRPLLR